MSSMIIAGVAVFTIMILYMAWASKAAPQFIGETPGGTPIYAADTPAAGIVIPANPAVAAAALAAGGAAPPSTDSAPPAASTGPAKAPGAVVPPPPTYTFHQGYGTNSDNLKVDTTIGGKIDELKKACNALAGCVGFTTYGALKGNVEKAKWVERNKADPKFGLYVRD